MLATPSGLGPVELPIDLHVGLWITGKVTDRRTGKPLERVRMHYLPFRDNRFARALPEFGERVTVAQDEDRSTTGFDGTYRLLGLPGRAIVGASDPRRHYLAGVGSESIAGMDEDGRFLTYGNPIQPGKTWPNAMKEIDPAEKTKSLRLDFELDSGASVRVRAVDPEGRPVATLEVGGYTLSNYGRSADTADFAVENLKAGEARQVSVRHQERKLGRVVTVRPGDDASGPVVVVLHPLATIIGRVLDSLGAPVAAAVVTPTLLPERDYGLELAKVTTDEAGRFRVPDVPVGCVYSPST